MSETTDQVLTLIEAVKDRPALYKKDKSLGTNREIQTALWHQISDIVHLPADRCKDRWRNLRDTYIKNVKSKEQLMSRGLLKEFREYKYSEAMKFLSATIMKKTTKKSQNSTIIQNPAKMIKKRKSTLDRNQKFIMAEQIMENGEEYLVECTDDKRGYFEDNKEMEDQEPFSYEMETFERTEGAKMESHDENNIFEVSNIDQNILEPPVTAEISSLHQFRTEPATDFDSWLHGIKETLMSLPPVYRAKAKKRINDVVSDCEINYLESIE